MLHYEHSNETVLLHIKPMSLFLIDTQTLTASPEQFVVALSLDDT